MQIVTQEDFFQLLKDGIRDAIQLAQKDCAFSLPQDISFELANYDQYRKEKTFDEIVTFLYKDGTFPRIIDVAVRGINDGKTLIWLRASGHEWVRDIAQTWNSPAGRGPFKSLGLLLPSLIWQRPRPFSIEDMEESGNTKYQQL